MKGLGGTGSQCKRARKTVAIKCRRCGRPSYHLSKKICSSCGFGKSRRMRKYNWAKSKD